MSGWRGEGSGCGVRGPFDINFRSPGWPVTDNQVKLKKFNILNILYFINNTCTVQIIHTFFKRSE